MAQRLRSRAAAAVAAGLAATCLGVAAAPAFADTVRNEEWWLTSLHVTKAWLSSRGTGVTVAVLDTGVDPTQPDLVGSVTTGRDFTGSGRTAGGPFWGVHGTAVASIIAGHGHGPHHADGIIGVAPLAKILSVRVTLENKDPLLASPTVVAALPTAIARGIRYAVRHGAQVIDLPLDPAAQAGGTTAGGSPAERSAVEAALAKGVVLVAPSGDNGAGSDTFNYPAAYPGVISVGAFGQGFVKAPFTNQQPYATLTAAGNGVIAANGLTGYAKLKSTSAASAVVAGIAALIRSQFPTFTPAQVEQALTSGTVFRHKGGRKDGSGFGTADAAAALLAAAKINATPTSAASPGTAANPTPPAAPKVHVVTKSLWQAVRIPVLGLVALVLLALIILITVRVRQRRALDAQLAPLQAAARASRAPAASGMTGMGSPGPGYGPPPGTSIPGRAPASSEPVGHGPANFGMGSTGLAGPGSAGLGSAGLGSAGLGSAGLGSAGLGSAALGSAALGSAALGSAGAAPAGAGLAGSGVAGGGSPGRAPGGNGFTSGGTAGSGLPGAGRPPSGQVARPVVSGKPPWEEDDALLPPAPAPAPPAPQPGRAGARFLLPGRGLGSLDGAAGRPGAGASADAGSAGRGLAGGGTGRTSSGTDSSSPGSEGRSTLNLGGWSLGKPSSGAGRAGARNGAAGSGTTDRGTADHAGNASTGNETPGAGGPGLEGSGTGTGSAGRGSPGPLGGIGGPGSSGAAAAARARFGPSPFDDPSFEMPAFNPTASGSSPLDDRVFGAPIPGASTPGGSTPRAPTLGRPTPGGPTPGAPGPGASVPGAPADAGRLAPPAGNAGSRGSGRHGAARGGQGGNPPATAGGASADSPAPGRTGDGPATARPPLGSAQRLNAVRAAGASGHPPWEPAEEPASELPWMDAPGSGQSRMVPPRRAFPVGAEGPAASGLATGGPGGGRTGTGRPPASTGRPPAAGIRPDDPPPMTASGLARRTPKSLSPFPELDGPPPGVDAPGSGSGEAGPDTSRPGYSWNPSDTTDATESFPAVPPPEDSHPG